MTQAVVQAPRQTVQVKDEVEFVPWGSEDQIKLSIRIVREMVAVPALDRETKQPILPDNRQAMNFMMLCRSRRLNPFEGDAFMVPFWDGRTGQYQWSLITAHNAYLKRAETHPEFDGFESGVILQTEQGEYIEIQGDFVPRTVETEASSERVKVSLVGGWARVHFKTRKIPTYRRAALETFAQSFGQWVKNPSGMIVKVAEADALRSAFPTLLGGLYLKEEIAIESEVTSSLPTEERRPAFARGLPAPSMGGEPAKSVQPAPGKIIQIDQRGRSQEASTKPAALPEQAPPQTQQAAASPKQPKGKGRVITPEPEPEGGFDSAAPATGTTTAPEPTAETTTANTVQEPAPEAAPEQEQGQPEPEQQGQPEGYERAPEELLPQVVDSEGAAVGDVKRLCIQHGVTEHQVMHVLYNRKPAPLARAPQKLRDLATLKLQSLVRNWNTFLPDFEKVPWQAE